MASFLVQFKESYVYELLSITFYNYSRELSLP